MANLDDLLLLDLRQKNKLQLSKNILIKHVLTPAKYPLNGVQV